MECKVAGCNRIAQTKGLCGTHYSRLRINGDPLLIHTNLGKSPVERFWCYIEVDERGCWNWTGGCSSNGYGNFTVNRKQFKPHRWAYEHYIGPIPDGLVLDHLCKNIKCANPAHVEPVTNGENVMRGESFSPRNARATHCKHGHEFTPENTRIGYHRKADRQQRICIECARAKDRRSHANRRARRKAMANAES